MERVATTLIDEDEQKQVLITEQEFDDAGRLKAIWSGPPKSEDAECLDVSLSCLDTSQARREKERVYEVDTGRVMEERFGGEYQGDHLYSQKYEYHPDNASPTPDTVRFFESVPDGEPGLIETRSSSYERDAFGRVIVERRSDGSVTYTTYDRTSNQPIRVRTGADAESRISYDGVGKQIQVFRPSGRGNTLYAYDFDGRLIRQETTTDEDGQPWVTTFTYDRTGRAEQVDYHDGTSESSTYNPDNTVDTFTTRDGILVTHIYDDANRRLSSVPSFEGGELPGSLVELDAGDFANWDELSRPTSLGRGSDGRPDENPALTVAYPSYDLASRPGEERVGARGAMGWTYDLYSRPTELTLPSGLSRDPNGSFQGFTRQFDTLDRVYDISGLGALTQATAGVTWHWGGAGRLYGLDTKTGLGTAARWGYIEGAGPQSQGDQPPSSKWKLGTLTWGAGAGSGPAAATEVPEHTWGQFAFGWRGMDGDPRDGAKVGRQVKTGLDAGGIDLFAGMGWSWQYDGGVRLTEAYPGRGNLTGDRPHDTAGFVYDYGKGDELDRIVDQAAGTIGNVETGAYGRILSRDGASFDYDGVGRRTEDDRHVYRWNWRSELIEVTVKDTWPSNTAPGDQVSPYAGHQIRYAYDAKGRLTSRIHRGPAPEGGGERPFIERRDYVWEHQGLVSEIGSGDVDATTNRWRKTYVPGLAGLDDAPQVMVENLAFGGQALYTYLRDELGTVIGIVAEEESSDPASPVVPARYLYTPYGEANVEAGPEVRRSRFDAGVTDVAGIPQAPGPDQKAGALRVSFSSALDSGSLNSSVIVERQGFGGWQSVPASEVLVGLATEEPSDLLVMLQSGWDLGTDYRVRLTTDLLDTNSRKLGTEQALEWAIPGAFEISIAYDQRFPAGFDNATAASNTLGGRFPGGQTSLFQGLWTDPVTGLNYARARWYDARNASWMSEDPLADIDSPNLYAFVSWKPHMSVDPYGLREGDWWDIRSYRGAWGKTGKELWNVASLGTLNRVEQQDNLGTWSGLGESTFNGIRSISNTASFGLQDSIYETQMEEGPGVKSIAKGAEQAVVDLFPIEEGAEIAVNWDQMTPEEKARNGFTALSKTAGVAALTVGGVQALRTQRAPRPAREQPTGGDSNVLRTGEGATAAELAASRGGPTGGRRGQAQRDARARELEAAEEAHTGNGPVEYQCWRCGETSTNPADMHLGHRNVPTSEGGNLSPINTCLEGAACNLSAGNRAAPTPGMSCAERGGCGAPYGRTNNTNPSTGGGGSS